MARGKRDLAGFGEVAGDKDNKSINNDDNINVNINNENGENKSMSAITDEKTDFLDDLLTGSNKKEDAILTGIYLQPELARILNGLGKKGGRGAKSRIVNDALRKLFIEKGLL